MRSRDSTPNRTRGYKLTLMDRLGPDGAHQVRAIGQALMGLPIALIGAGMFVGRFDLPTWATILWVVIVTLVLTCVFAIVAVTLSNAAGSAAHFVVASGAGTPSEEQFSREDALVMQRRYDEALRSYEEHITANPAGTRARLRAAELYSREGNDHRRAAELFREVQKLSTDAGQVILASNRLVDLYLGPLQDDGRAMVELAKLADRFPGTAAGVSAREALARMKAERAAAGDA